MVLLRNSVRFGNSLVIFGHVAVHSKQARPHSLAEISVTTMVHTPTKWRATAMTTAALPPLARFRSLVELRVTVEPLRSHTRETEFEVGDPLTRLT